MEKGLFILDFSKEWLEKAVRSEGIVFEEIFLFYDELLNVFTDLEKEDKAS